MIIENLKALNNKLISHYENDQFNLKKQLLIQKLLEEESNCFFKMKIETAYALLKDLNIPESDIKETYLELIDIKNYYE